jgi:prophage antirepressor-like protein
LTGIATVFEFDSLQLRTTVVDGEPWFAATDICRILGISNTTMALRPLDDDEKGLRRIETPGGAQEINVVNESGLYTLIVRSDKPAAKPFRKWVTSEVLPAIRKTGRYDLADRNVSSIAIPRSFADALQLAADQARQIEQQAAELEANAPKVAYVDNFLRDGDACLIRKLAKRIGMTERELRDELMARGVIFRRPIENRFSESKQKWVTEYQYEASTKYMAWFVEGDQLNAPRHHNGQLRSTLYVTPAGKVGIARLLGRLDSTPLQLEGASA